MRPPRPGALLLAALLGLIVAAPASAAIDTPQRVADISARQVVIKGNARDALANRRKLRKQVTVRAR